MAVRDSKRVTTLNKKIGKAHPRVKLTDHEIDLIRELNEQGYDYKRIAKKFERTARSRGAV
jgi:hypothetical protein